jgi:serine/threonine protein kinase
LSGPGWTEISGSPFEWERDALAFIRQRFPDRDPYRAWTNFEFIDHDGSINEVDLLVFSPRGAFLVEIKSWPERTEGDGGTWFRARPDGSRRAFDNPLLLTNRKAKRLKSLLENQMAKQSAGSKQLPFLQPLVFLSHPRIAVQLESSGRVGVCVRDVDGDRPAGGYPGIVETLTTINEDDKARRNFRPWRTKDAQAFAAALDGIGVRETNRRRRVGDWELAELLEEGEGWQEYAATHAAVPDTARRIRIFGAGSKLDKGLVAAAAKREFQGLEPLEHPSIFSPKDYVEAERGPALLYDREPKAITLDHFLDESSSRLTIDQRLAIVRQLGEALSYAHARDLTHRALSPRSVLVRDPDAENIEVKIRDWHVSHRTTASTQHTGTLTAHADLLTDQAAEVYLAPETGRSRAGQHLDVFALGAIAFHVFSGKRPAASMLELHERLESHKGLDLAAVVDGARDIQRLCVLEATAPEVSKRTASIKEFLANLDAVEGELRDPEEDEAEDPTTASKGQFLAGYEVVSRLGRGGTAIAFLVRDGDDLRVLKVAATKEHNSRIRQEGEVIASVDHPVIAKLYRDDVMVQDHAAILIEFAGDATLADRLRSEGPPGLEILERWGENLLQAVLALETQGVAHRDIKPDNIGIRKRPPRDELRLTIFDFSLSRAPLDAIDAGTPPYLDPFLKGVGRQRWDLSAERFAAAMTLYELATGQLPTWGDGNTDPHHTSVEVTIDDQLFEPSVAEQLGAFFKRALARDSAERFDSAEEMLTAWRQSFESASLHPTETLHPDERDAKLAAATPATLVGDLPLAARARSALRGRGVTTVADLLSASAFDLRAMPGVGAGTRDEILEVFYKLTDLLPADDAPDVQGLDLLAKQLVPSKGLDEGERALLRRFLGFEGPVWATAPELASEAGVARDKVEAVVHRGRERWVKSLPSVTRLRDEIAEQLDSDGGFLPIGMLQEAILVRRGAVAQGDERRRLAVSAVRAALEAESRRESPRFNIGRAGDLIVAARTEAIDPGDALTYLKKLASRAEELVTDQPIATERLAESLRSLDPPTSSPLSAERLGRLADQASARVAMNSRGELYPVGMAAGVAVDRAAGALTIGAQLKIEEVKSRVSARYPEGESLPDRPQLDELLKPLGLKWDDATSRFAPIDSVASTTRFTGGTTTDVGPVPTKEFTDRLARSRDRFLALTARSKVSALAESRLAERDGVTHVPLDRALIRHMRDYAAENEAKWDAVLQLDVDSDDVKNWNILRGIARTAAGRLRDELLATPGTVLAGRAGLLDRYGCLGILEEVRRQIEVPGTDHPLKGLWLLVPVESKDARPVVGRTPIPVLDQNDWIHVPTEWARGVTA